MQGYKCFNYSNQLQGGIQISNTSNFDNIGNFDWNKEYIAHRYRRNLQYHLIYDICID